jgi:hypothetical protein
MKEKILREVHNLPFKGGHTGVQRTYAKLSQQVFWNGMFTDVRKYVESCHQCQLVKQSKVRYGKITQRIEKDNRIFYKLSIDTNSLAKRPNFVSGIGGNINSQRIFVYLPTVPT